MLHVFSHDQDGSQVLRGLFQAPLAATFFALEVLEQLGVAVDGSITLPLSALDGG